jgi:hypothetical protein
VIEPSISIFDNGAKIEDGLKAESLRPTDSRDEMSTDLLERTRSRIDEYSSSFRKRLEKILT